jgi:class 3 adenylate cyclase
MRTRPWPDGRSIRIRIGIHAGRPTASATGYVGIAVNTVARVCQAASGGQVLLTRAAKEAAGDKALPGELRLHGTERLRGIPEPVELWELVVQD